MPTEPAGRLGNGPCPAPPDPIQKIRRRAALAALSGILAAGVIFATAKPEASNPLGDLTDSKASMRQLELYGGDANVLSVELQQGFDALWHGKKLAGTILTLSLLGSLGYLALATRMHQLRLVEDQARERAKSKPSAP